MYCFLQMDEIKQYLYQVTRRNCEDEELNWIIRETLIQSRDEFDISAYGFLKLNFSMLSSVS